MDLRQQRWDVGEKRELFRLQIMCGRAALNDSRSVGRSVKVHNLKVNKNAQVTKKNNQEAKKNHLTRERWKLRHHEIT